AANPLRERGVVDLRLDEREEAVGIDAAQRAVVVRSSPKAGGCSVTPIQPAEAVPFDTAAERGARVVEDGAIVVVRITLPVVDRRCVGIARVTGEVLLTGIGERAIGSLPVSQLSADVHKAVGAEAQAIVERGGEHTPVMDGSSRGLAVERDETAGVAVV